MQAAGYSGTPLVKKLGIKENFTIKVIRAPEYYFELVNLPEKTQLIQDKETKKNLIHYFTKEKKELEKDISTLREEIFANGIIWISWPKKTSKVVTDLTEEVVRRIALANGLVDIKVCAIDEVWSALKLVIPVQERKPL